MSEEIKEVPEMLPLRECSKGFGLSYGTLRSMCNRKIIPCIRVGSKGKMFINADVLRDYLKGSHEVSL